MKIKYKTPWKEIIPHNFSTPPWEMAIPEHLKIPVTALIFDRSAEHPDCFARLTGHEILIIQSRSTDMGIVLVKLHFEATYKVTRLARTDWPEETIELLLMDAGCDKYKPMYSDHQEFEDWKIEIKRRSLIERFGGENRIYECVYKDNGLVMPRQPFAEFYVDIIQHGAAYASGLSMGSTVREVAEFYYQIDRDLLQRKLVGEVMDHFCRPAGPPEPEKHKGFGKSFLWMNRIHPVFIEDKESKKDSK